jgi:hypothetical protein
VLLLRHLYGYSEFLASFFLLSLLTSFLRPIVLRVGGDAFFLAVFIAVSVVASLVEPFPSDIPIVGALIGSRDYATFPLIQYMPWFLFGVYYSGHDRPAGWTIWAAAAVATGAFGYYIGFLHMLPRRFPPSVVWTFGSALPLLFYLQVCGMVAKLFSLPNWLFSPGRHVLRFLVASNAVIFTAVFVFGKQPMGLSEAVIVAIPIGALILGVSLLWERILQWRTPFFSRPVRPS